MSEPKDVYSKIAAVQAALAREGIKKTQENTFDKYKFRGIDEVYNTLAPLLAVNGLCILPRILERDCQERVSRKGDPMFYVTVAAEFDFVSAADGSTHTVRTYGEAMDRADKATNKAMSAAYKYAAFMTFAIPTEGDNDADAETHEVAPRKRQDETPNFISDGDVILVNQLCETLGGGEVQNLCKAYKIKTVSQLTETQAPNVIERLKRKLADKVKAETQDKAKAEGEFNNFANELNDEIPF